MKNINTITANKAVKTSIKNMDSMLANARRKAANIGDSRRITELMLLFIPFTFLRFVFGTN